MDGLLWRERRRLNGTISDIKKAKQTEEKMQIWEKASEEWKRIILL